MSRRTPPRPKTACIRWSEPLETRTLFSQVIWSENFDSGWNGFTTDAGVWEVGAPTTTPPGGAHSGANVAGTVLAGNYPIGTDSRLISPPVVLPSLSSPNERLQLRYWQSYSYSGGDRGTVQARVWTGSGFGPWGAISIVGRNADHSPADAGASSEWSVAAADLTGLAGQEVQLGFSHSADGWGDVAPGWYVDDVAVWRGVPTFTTPEDFEGGWRDWTSDGGVWQIGMPASPGPSAGWSGQCAGTNLDGNYPVGTDSSLISPEVVLPVVGAGERVEFRFGQWYSMSGGDKGSVELRVLDPATNSWTWQTLAVPAAAGASSRDWTQVAVDVTRFQGRRVQLAFKHEADGWGDVAPGWYIDGVQLWQGAPAFDNPSGFENGWQDWSTDGGVWDIGVPSTVPVPGGAHGGTKVAGTVLAGTYPVETDSRLISPPMTLPKRTSFDDRVQLRFHQSYSYSGGDNGALQVRVWDGIKYGDWANLAVVGQDSGYSPAASGASSEWSRVAADLTPYAGMEVQVAFFHRADGWGDVAAGWYVDDVSVWRGVPPLNSPHGFESGWGDWSTDGGLWQIGSPASPGPTAAQEGASVAGTNLDGLYPPGTRSTLVSPEVVLPNVSTGQHIQLQFWQWYSMSGGDRGEVRLRVYDQQSGTWSWTTLATPAPSGSSSNWAPAPGLFLDAYQGKRVQVGFVHTADGWGDVAAGWYIDSVQITPTPAPRTWDGGGDGVRWGDANNWNNNTLPGANEDVRIDVLAGDPNVVIDVPVSVRRVHSTENITIATTGSLAVQQPSTFASLTVNGAASATLRGQTWVNGTLAVTGNGNVSLAATTSVVPGFILARGLSLGSGSRIDLHNGDLILDYDTGNPLAVVQGWVSAARNGGAWDGAGITSTTARTEPDQCTTLGVMDAADYRSIEDRLASATFDGIAVDETMVLVKYTYYGDADFSGGVDFDDYVRTDGGFNGQKGGWLNGDFDGSELVDFDDYVLIDLGFNTQGAPL